MNNMTKRLEALETAAVKTQGPEKIDIVHVIVAPDRSIVGACRYGEARMLVPVSVEELADIRREAKADQRKTS